MEFIRNVLLLQELEKIYSTACLISLVYDRYAEKFWFWPKWKSLPKFWFGKSQMRTFRPKNCFDFYLHFCGFSPRFPLGIPSDVFPSNGFPLSGKWIQNSYLPKTQSSADRWLPLYDGQIWTWFLAKPLIFWPRKKIILELSNWATFVFWSTFQSCSNFF